MLLDVKLDLYETAPKDHPLTELVFQMLLHLFASQYDPYQHLHINPVLHHQVQEHVHMQEDTKLDLYDGVPKDHIDLQQGEGAPEKHIQSVDVQKEVLLHIVASQ